VIDGGSTDGSVAVIEGYAQQLFAGTWPVRCAEITMHWVSRRDNGQSDAINQGMRRATGDIVSYVNSDDLYADHAFQRVADAFQAHPDADFIYGDGDVIDETGHLQWEWLSRPYSQAVMTGYHPLWNDFTNYIMQQATFWRRHVIDRIGYFDEAFHYAMDVEYWVRAGAAGLRLKHVPYKLGQFRLIQGTKSLSSPTAFWEDYLEIFRRYRGARSMAFFFAFYYFNLAQQCSGSLETAIELGRRVFDRWSYLPTPEQQILWRQAEKGVPLACLLLANHLYTRHDLQGATRAFAQGIRGRPLVVLHPLALFYLLCQTVGLTGADRLHHWIGRLISAYRRQRYQYRYFERSHSVPAG
jgi:GT2 family glycosyltransferase